MAMTKPISTQVTYTPAGTGAVATTVQNKLREWVSATDFGVVADWDGATGTDQTTQLQAAIDSFGVRRGVVFLPDGAVRADSARINFKRVSIIGRGTTNTGANGGSDLYVGALGGLYTTIEDNLAPRHENFRVISSSEKLANGQVLMDLTGLNYPNLTNVTLYGGEVGLKLSKGATVETHYGTFVNLNCSRCYTGISVNTGLFAQTHSFFGGRMWDCVEGYANEDTGAADINFYGTAFESGQAIRHAATATAAQTKWFGCRNESSAASAVTVGQFTQIGTYWSGNRRAETVAVTPTGASGVLVESNTQIRNIGVNNAVEFGAPNVLPNSLFEFDPSASRTGGTNIPGWAAVSATHYDTGKGTEGNYIRLERQAASGTVLFQSRKIPLKKGRYMFSCGHARDGYGLNGVVSIDFLRAGATFGAGGTYADLTFPYTYTTASEQSIPVEILQDIDDFQFRISCTASTNGRYFYVWAPQMVQGQRGIVSVPNRDAATVLWGNAAPTTGNWEAGDIVYNTTPSSSTTAAEAFGWVCVAGGAPGTWKPIAVMQSISATGGNGSYTITAGVSATTQRITAALTGNRTITLDTTGAWSGAKFRVVRTAASTGAFTTDVGGLKTLATGQWCDVEYDGSAWLLTAFGSL